MFLKENKFKPKITEKNIEQEDT